jgi:hypothetical protein
MRKSIYDRPEVKVPPYTAAFLSSIPVARAKPTLPESGQMIEAMERRVAEIVAGRFSPQTGLDTLAVDLQRILGKKARLRYSVRSRP